MTQNIIMNFLSCETAQNKITDYHFRHKILTDAP